MIEITNVDVFGFEGAIRGMRNPMNSWSKSDSCWDYPLPDCFENCGNCPCVDGERKYEIGVQDMELAKRLVKAGSSHRKFMRMIHVQADIKAPLYLWKEFETYKVGTATNSCSTMHKLTEKEFTVDDFSHEHLSESSFNFLNEIVKKLNVKRKDYLRFYQSPSRKFTENSDDTLKNLWWQMIQLLPSSYNQLRTLDTNYETLLNIYQQRRNHKLDEWRVLCEWIETLPYMKDFLSVFV